VWTPKRVLLLSLGFAVFFAAYLVYASFLGGINGLPPLPLECLPSADAEPVNPPPPRKNQVDQKLRMAFGEDCRELKRAIKLEVRAHGIVLTADQFVIEKDGRVLLKPFSIALFGKSVGPDGTPEINTIRSDEAYLTFDRPVNSPAEIGSRRIVGGTLTRASDGGGDEKGVTIVNNRRTARRDDDLCLFTPGPVDYDESLHLIWTKGVVRVTDQQSKPNQTEITATGMDVYLAQEPPPTPGKTPAKKSKTPTVSGVERIRLRNDVDMHLWVDSHSGFLGSSKTAAPTAPPAAEKPAATPEKVLVIIRTPGPFNYYLQTDHAQFDISEQRIPRPNNVEVRRRYPGDGGYDQLYCDHLELQFHRKAPAASPAGAPAADQPVDLDIDSAHAWGSLVTITSDNEVMTATGKDFTYDAKTRRSVLRSDPERGGPELFAAKDGNEIYARELVLTGLGGKEGQQALAKGPGRIHIRNQSAKPALRARWKDTLVSSKDGNLDVLTLTGDAAFEDDDRGQVLRADRLKLWLEPAPPTPPEKGTTPAAASGDSQRRRPHHVEASGRVVAHSAEMNVHDTEYLEVVFRDAPAPPGPAPVGSAQVTSKPLGSAAPASPAPVSPSGPAPGQPAANSGNAKKPIQLSARSVKVTVLRSGEKNDLQDVTCDGAVRVHQDPAGPDDKGVDIRGDTLHLDHFAEGNVLAVTGNPAEVLLDKLFILGPEVNIDQKENKAWVNGVGAMRMPSNKSFQGNELARPTELTVYWNKNMYFNGQRADFDGGIQADQDNARVSCQTMQVSLDRRVSLKDGEKSGPPAKVEKLLCDKNVNIEDTVRNEDGRLERYQRIVSKELDLDNLMGQVNAPGPGVVTILQLGAKGDAFGGPPPVAGPPGGRPKPAPAEEELKVTRVTYLGKMWADNNKRIIKFFSLNNDYVEVVNAPSDNPDAKIDPDHLPPGGMHLRCRRLEVYSKRLPGGKANQQMEAHGQAEVHAQDFWGRADVIKYDEAKQLVVFEGLGNLATLYRVRRKGEEPQEIKARKIRYRRATNDFDIEGGTGINGTGP
jgi:hypothetical protein